MQCFVHGLCFPSLLHDQQMPSEGAAGTGGIGADSTSLASTTMVLSHFAFNQRLANLAATVARHVDKSMVGIQHPLLQTNGLSLVAWRLSGNISLPVAFLMMQLTSSQSPGDQVLDQLTAGPGRGGLACVVKSRMIHFNPLWQ